VTDAVAPRVMLVQTQAENAGAQEISRLIAADFSSRGFEVHQIFFFRRTASFDRDANVEYCAAERPAKPIAFLRFLLRLYGAMRRIRPDVVIAFQHYGNIIATPIARLAGARRVVANQVSAGALMGSAVLAADKLLGSIGAYDRIVVNSRHTEEMYANYPRRYRERLIRVDHGFEDKSSAISKTAARAELGLPQNVKLIGCAARLHPFKQLDAAVGVLPLLADVRLALAGQGQDQARLEAAARDLNVADRVFFLGELAPERIGVLHAALDCFVFPSRAETFGLAPVEAAQSGTPVVANDLEVLREVLCVDDAACAIFVDVRDRAAFAEAINRALFDEALIARLTASGRRLKQRFPLSAMMDAYSDLVEQLMDRGQ
jgi:glycosyltransferase involved in cell wall biosynthesis